MGDSGKAREDTGMGGRSLELARCAVATTQQVENYFKKISMREAVFKIEKLRLKDAELHADERFRRSNEEERVAPAKSRVKRSPRSRRSPQRLQQLQRSGGCSAAPGLGHSRSSPGDLGVGAAGRGPRAFAEPGAPGGQGCSRNRFGAQHPFSEHPAVHPGAVARRPHMGATRYASYFGSPKDAQEIGPDGSAVSSWFVAQPAAAVSACSSPARPRSGHLASAFSPSSPQSPVLRRSVDPPFGGVDDEVHRKEEAAYAILDSTNNLLKGTLRRRQADSADDIRRLGDFLALLGPRFKCIEREKLYERAAMGDVGKFQRQLQSGVITVAEVGGQKKPWPGEAPDADLDGKDRRAWLSIRRMERERRIRAPAGLEDLGI